MREIFSVGIILNDEEDKILLVLHRNLNKWLPPGGHVEENETPDAAIIREVKEEIGLDTTIINNSNLDIHINNGRENTFTQPYFVMSSKGSNDRLNLNFVYKLKLTDGQIQIQKDELLDVKWFTKEEVLRLDSFESLKIVAQKLMK